MQRQFRAVANGGSDRQCAVFQPLERLQRGKPPKGFVHPMVAQVLEEKGITMPERPKDWML